jgi:hypothetical protein
LDQTMIDNGHQFLPFPPLFAAPFLCIIIIFLF